MFLSALRDHDTRNTIAASVMNRLMHIIGDERRLVGRWVDEGKDRVTERWRDGGTEGQRDGGTGSDNSGARWRPLLCLSDDVSRNEMNAVEKNDMRLT